MKKICIFHFSPLELFPPIMNMVAFLDSELPENYSIRVYTTSSARDLQLFATDSKRVTVKRFGKYDTQAGGFKRMKLYLVYNLLSFLNAFLWKPGKVMYYETFSTLPAFFLKKLRPDLPLFVHYHEYMSPEEYNGSKLLKKVHEIEKKLYSRVQWISHTNEDRLKMFAGDEGLSSSNKLHALPNYPSLQWGITSPTKQFTIPVKIVYVGAIGLDTLYIKEFALWVESQEGNVIWDIYTQQDDRELKTYLALIGSKYINVKGYISYHQLPEMLSKYNVGVILYKGLSPNFIYNAPNKLFEYLACGLDVWFPQQLKGGYPFIRTHSFPKIINVNFDDLVGFELEKIIDRKELPYKPSEYCYEEQYQALKNAIMQ